MKHLRRILPRIFILFYLPACALLGGGDEEVGVKNKNILYSPPDAPYYQVLISSADYVWQSKKTGSTIAVNSLCNKYQDASLDSLKKNILSGVENLKLEKTERITNSGQEAEKIKANGTTDGVAISISLVILKKSGCTFDVAYISRTKTFKKEVAIFEKFLTGFSVPQ